MNPRTTISHNRKCVRCGVIYDVRLPPATDTHCGDCLMKGMP